MAWFNSVDSAVIDRWLAFYWLKSDVDSTGKKQMAPEQALKQLQARHG